MKRLPAALALLAGLLVSCGAQVPEMTLDEIAFAKKAQHDSLLSKTVDRPGSAAPYGPGRPGGTWVLDITDDPKSFNLLDSKDAETARVVDSLYEPLLDYDPYRKEWKARAASYEVKVDRAAGTMRVVFTLRDDLYWTSLAEPGRRVKVTSDDVVYWYNDVVGDPLLQQSGYAGQFVRMPDGSRRRIVARKLDARRFELVYPRVVAEPELSSNMTFGPRYVFEPLKEAKGDTALLNLWSIDTDPRTIPSMGPYYIESYKPAIGVTLVRNPSYWRRDDHGRPIPYIDRIELRIIPNKETEKLKFLSGDLSTYSLRPEDLDDMVGRTAKDYTVYYAGASLGADFISWNQNPKNLAAKYVRWFSNVKFRRAMACFINRGRIVREVFRGLAEPDLDFFAKTNPFYDPAIREEIRYDPARGKRLLAEIGIRPDSSGRMRDAEGNLVEFELAVPASDDRLVDMADVYADELAKAGIRLDVRPTDFQKIVESLLEGYDWQSVMISVGPNYFPTEGDNVWLSGGNLHLWNPLQAKPATAWEAELDDLYWKGYTTRDPAAAKAIWDRFQRLILDEVPVAYLVYPDSFVAIRDGWANVRVDTIDAPDLSYVYLRR